MTDTQVTCPQLDGADGSVYFVVSTTADGIGSVIEDIADRGRYGVPTSWLVPFVATEVAE